VAEPERASGFFDRHSKDEMSRAGFKRRQTGQLPRAFTSKRPPQNSKKYYLRKHKNTF